MYCIKCGVGLADGQSACPLCGTKVAHPDFPVTEKPTYPKGDFPSEAFNRVPLLFVITILWLLPLFLPLILEYAILQKVTWSGYVTGGVALAYLFVFLPLWWKHPNPVIFVPIDFAGVLVYLLYICLATGGNWFMSFAFPVVGSFGIIITAMVALSRYARRGMLYILGGGSIAIGIWTVLIDWDIRATFGVNPSFMWSLAPLIALSLIGMLLIVVAIVRPFREGLRKIFFV
jgi:hypothetical protein